jgi:hypothetical protein
MIFLSELTPGEIGTSGIIIAVITILTVLGFVRGAVKLIFLLFTIAGAGYAGYWGSQEGLTYLQRQWPAAPEQLGSVFAVICGLIAFFFLSKIFSFFTDPFENSDFISRVAFGVPAALVSLIAATGLVWLSLNFLKDKGAEGEIKYWITQDDENKDARLKSYPTLANLKRSFESSGVGKKMADLYKLHDREKFNLAKLLVIASTSKEKIKELGEDERVVKIMRNLEVRKLMNNTGLRKQIAGNDVQGILANPLFNEALQDKSLMKDLISINSKELR